MLKRFKVSLYAAALAGFTLLATGCSFGSWWPFNTDVDSVPRIIGAILRETLLG